ncbi:class I SAM-dependent RNA methyltransferase [Fibrobacter sp. HC4]|uniref:THUMP domain-containing class I SAM-dependent RNA methyltransferase n=1 Tax=Fibrobacter sp. HC4 TaxID=3239812 RepID=UPI0020185C4F|nr:RNA methyltransferase [Fibrobacter succinogenes]MCL4100795.1 Ribosomal RNA large subunit methyltransferase K/L [Fibrobacter succinogenes]
MNSSENKSPESNLEKRLKRQVIGKPHRFMAVVPLGFEETLVEELKYIGVECVQDCTANGNCAAGIKVAGDGKVEFTAKITEAWKAVAYSRIANRVLMEIATFKAENFGQLEKGVAAVPWELYLGEMGVVIHVTCRHSRLYHSDAVEERIRKNITPTDHASAPQHLYVNLQDDRCTLWLDLAGEELYKRGHERFVAEAPLKETIAAAMIFEAIKLQTPEFLTTNHQPLTTTFIDGMAGSGTFSLEAAYIANGLIPGKCRDFALKHQPAFKEGTWNFILKGRHSETAAPLRHSETAAPLRHSEERSDEESTTNLLSIITSDISERPIGIIKHNVEVSPLPADIINPQLKDFFSYTIDDICAVRPSANDTARDIVILLNPPYGKRLAFDAPKLYTKIGQKLDQLGRDAQSCGASITVAILAPKDDTRGGAHYTCTENLLKACPALNPSNNPEAKLIETSHGGFSLNAIFARI